jgi:hypothetical protein
MSGELVALTSIEWPDEAGGSRRLAPGERIPKALSSADVNELRKDGSIGSREEYDKQQADAEADTAEQLARAAAEAAGGRFIKASDGGSGSDKKA